MTNCPDDIQTDRILRYRAWLVKKPNITQDYRCLVRWLKKEPRWESQDEMLKPLSTLPERLRI